GTATKLVLNTLTTASMARLGRVYGNRMIDVQPRSRKLRERAVRLVAELGRVPMDRARRELAASGGRVRVAIVMSRTGCAAPEAAHAPRRAKGSLAAATALGAERRERAAGRAAGRPGLGSRARGEQGHESRKSRGDHQIRPTSPRRRSRSLPA